LTWLELGDIERAPTLKGILALNKDENISDTAYIHQLLKCYVLGDFLLAEEFQNSVMDLLIAKCNLSLQSHLGYTGLDPTSISYIISNTLPGSPLRKMLYDYWAAIIGRENSMRYDIPKEFYHQISMYVIVAYRQGRELKAPWNQDRCIYHSHSGQPDQYLCTKRS
jgi:hypothetical protein